VDFELNADQVALAEGVAKLCAGRVPPERLRELEHVGGVDRDLWRELGDAGVFALRLPEDGGGVGLGMAEAGVVFQELGRALVPGPLVWTHLAASIDAKAASGERVVTGVARDSSGTRRLVIDHLGVSDAVLVLDSGGTSMVPAAEVVSGAREVVVPTDPLTPVWIVDDLAPGELVGDSAMPTRLALEGAALAAAMQVGIARRATDLAVAYAKEREQFNRPIGSFQAVKHILADMLVRAEVARAAADAAAVTLDQPEIADPRRAVAAAKAVAGEAAVRNSEACIQVHGGMGFTWEAIPHLYLKRAWVLDAAFGSADASADEVAALVKAATSTDG
jgi:alkylation response protein AidB-like acyl-CoA dehydrogenase